MGSSSDLLEIALEIKKIAITETPDGESVERYEDNIIAGIIRIAGQLSSFQVSTSVSTTPTSTSPGIDLALADRIRSLCNTHNLDSNIILKDIRNNQDAQKVIDDLLARKPSGSTSPASGSVTPPQNTSTEASSTSSGNNGTQGSAGITLKQAKYIRDLCGQLGYEEEGTNKILEGCKTNADARVCITDLKNELEKLRKQPLTVTTTSTSASTP